jgi:two-component system CheB/CheR fusion protein
VVSGLKSKENKKAIFTLLKHSFNVDFTHYKSLTIYRRINRRMVITQKETLESYTEYLQSNPQELKALYDSMLIAVTSFFREPSTFSMLQRKVNPKILTHRTADDP